MLFSTGIPQYAWTQLIIYLKRRVITANVRRYWLLLGRFQDKGRARTTVVVLCTYREIASAIWQKLHDAEASIVRGLKIISTTKCLCYSQLGFQSLSEKAPTMHIASGQKDLSMP